MSDYRINEIFLNAEELGEQVLIVEGVDDVTLYENMFKEQDYTIYAVETIEKMDSDDCEYYKAGCDGVKKAIEEAKTKREKAYLYSHSYLEETLLEVMTKAWDLKHN